MFNAANLPEAMALWYARLLEVIGDIHGAKNPSVDLFATEGELYTGARIVGSYAQALRMAYRVTKSPALLAEAVRIMTLWRGSLADYDHDGYLEWVSASTGRDDNMDRGLAWMQCAGFVQWLSYHTESYPTEYADWLDVLTNHFIIQGYFNDDLIHMASHHLRWLRFMVEMQLIPVATLRYWVESVFMPHMLTDSGGAFVWDHRRILPYYSMPALYAQPVVYAASETLASILELYMCNVSPFCGAAYMTKWMMTGRDNLLRDGIGDIKIDVTAGLGYSWIEQWAGATPEPARYARYAIPAYSAWDETGKIEGLNTYTWDYLTKQTLELPAYALIGAAIRYINEHEGSRPWIT
jgi:hypothetical protein